MKNENIRNVKKYAFDSNGNSFEHRNGRYVQIADYMSLCERYEDLEETAKENYECGRMALDKVHFLESELNEIKKERDVLATCYKQLSDQLGIDLGKNAPPDRDEEELKEESYLDSFKEDVKTQCDHAYVRDADTGNMWCPRCGKIAGPDDLK